MLPCPFGETSGQRAASTMGGARAPGSILDGLQHSRALFGRTGPAQATRPDAASGIADELQPRPPTQADCRQPAKLSDISQLAVCNAPIQHLRATGGSSRIHKEARSCRCLSGPSSTSRRICSGRRALTLRGMQFCQYAHAGSGAGFLRAVAPPCVVAMEVFGGAPRHALREETARTGVTPAHKSQRHRQPQSCGA